MRERRELHHPDDERLASIRKIPVRAGKQRIGITGNRTRWPAVPGYGPDTSEPRSPASLALAGRGNHFFHLIEQPIDAIGFGGALPIIA